MDTSLLVDEWALEPIFFCCADGSAVRWGRKQLAPATDVRRTGAKRRVAAVAGALYAQVERTVEGLGYELVDLERAGGGLLRVTIDAPAAPRGVTVDDCEKVSHQLTHLFAVEGVAYERLEVSSPGLDRPLKKARDYQRFLGAEIRVQLFSPLQGRKRLHGRLLELAGVPGQERVRLELLPDEAAVAVRRVSAVPARGKGSGRNKGKAPAVPAQVVEFALADVDKARVVPLLDFRSGQS
jgi:ribosome maturation factor RimP